jgi:hypothetical protein
MDRIQKIKYKRLTPAERYLFDILNNPNMILTDDNNYIIYYLDNINIMQYSKETKHFYITSHKIWFVLTQTYLLRSDDIQRIITKLKINGNI